MGHGMYLPHLQGPDLAGRRTMEVSGTRPPAYTHTSHPGTFYTGRASCNDSLFLASAALELNDLPGPSLVKQAFPRLVPTK